MNKQISTVPIKGMNTSTNDNSVEDGYCSTLKNMRYDNKSWRVVGKPIEVGSVSHNSNDPYLPVYLHPIASNNQFIVRNNDGGMNDYYYRSVNNWDYTYHLITSYSESVNISISHFGNALIFRDGTSIKYYLFKNGEYILYEKPEPPIIEVLATNKLIHPDITDHYITSNLIAFPFFGLRIYCEDGSESTYSKYSDSGYWYGRVALFACYKMSDGSYIQPSRLIVLESADERFASNETDIYSGGGSTQIGSAQFVLYNNRSTDNKEIVLCVNSDSSTNFTSNNFMIKPVVSISNDSDIWNSVESVCLFATRILPRFDESQIGISVNYPTATDSDVYTSDDFFTSIHDDLRSIFDQTDLIDSPFYLVKEYFEGDSKSSITLNYDTLSDDNLVNNDVYSPDSSMHDIHPEVLFEYNNRLHFGNITSKLYGGYPTIFDALPIRAFYTYWGVEINYDTYNVESLSESSDDNPNTPSYVNGKILSYPDYRAKYVIINGTSHQSIAMSTGKLTASASTSNNIAYYLAPSTKYAIHPDISIATSDNVSVDLSDTFTEPNRIQVTGQNNPLTYPFDNSYEIGENSTVLALNTLAGGLSDTPFGTFPLYVFTDKGLFTLESGNDNVLYSQILPLTRDIATSPNTISAFGQVFFINNRGVHAISGSITQTISTDLNTNDFYSFLEGAYMIAQHKYNNVLIINDDYDIAYVYNIESGAWSTREFSHTPLWGVYTYGLSADYNVVYDWSDEDIDPDAICTIITRPIKFGSRDLKRLQTLITRTLTNSIQVDVYASNDRTSWHKITSRSLSGEEFNDVRFYRFPISAKYYKFHVVLNNEDSESQIEGWDCEYIYLATHKFR